MTGSGGFVRVSQREAAASSVAWLSDGQLNHLIFACHQLADAASAELNGRQPR